MYLSVNGKIVKMNPLPIEVWEAINSADNYNDTVSLYKNETEYLEAIRNYDEGYQLKFNNSEGSFKTYLDCIDEDEVKKIFNGYYFDELEWKNHFRWEKKNLFNWTKNLLLGFLALTFFIFLAINGFNRNAAFDKIFNFFEKYGISSYLVLLLLFLIILYSDLEYIRNYNKIRGYDKIRITLYIFILPFILFLIIHQLIA